MQKDINNGAPSLISRDASTAIKGLLMLLVVFGHTYLLTTDFSTGEKSFLWYWLYTFHVYIFFILPFIYGHKREPIDTNRGGYYVDYQQVILDVKRSIIKIGVPYTWFFILSAIIYVVVGDGQFDIKGLLYTFFWGNEPLIDQYIGFNFMWFLPAMLSLLVLKSVYYNSCKSIRIAIVGISVVLWSIVILNYTSLYIIGMYIPFAISQAFFFIILGLTSRYILQQNWSAHYQMPIILLLIVGLSALLLHSDDIQTQICIPRVLRLCMPILAFLLLYSIQNILTKSKLLKLVGTYSLQIYLLHVFVLNALTQFFLHFTNPSVGLGILIYSMSLLICCVIAKIFSNVPLINRVVFPKG